MKIVSSLLLVLGVVALVATLGWTLYILFFATGNFSAMVNVANNMRSVTQFPNPVPLIFIGVGLALLAGLLIGLSVGMPKQTRKALERDAVDAYKLEQARSVAPQAAPVGEEPQPEKNVGN